jgi:hypothetical protein
LGLFLAEGYCSQNQLGFHVRKQSTIDMIEDILKKLKMKYKKYNYIYNNKKSTTFRVYKKTLNKEIWNELNTYGHWDEKFIPSYLFNTSKNNITSFLEGFIEGDGHVSKSNIHAFSGNKKLILGIQQLYFLIGKNSRIRILYNKIYKNKIFDLIAINSNNVGVESKKHIKEIKYNGLVYCLELQKNSILFVKRNNKCVWSGNSIEAACFGAVSLTNYTGNDYPFIKTDINNLKETLIKYLNDYNLLKQEQDKIVKWRKENYTPEILLKIYENIYEDMLKGKYFIKENFTPVEIVELNKQELPKPINNIPTKEVVCEIINTLNNLKIDFWLLKDSCLETLVNKQITSNKFTIGVNSIIDKNIITNQLIKYSTFLDIIIDPKRETKAWKIYELDVKVPCPLIKYLTHYTKKSWEEIKRNIKNE